MKKAIIFWVIVIAILTSLWYILNQRKVQSNIIQSENKSYEESFEKEITGTELVSTIKLKVKKFMKMVFKNFYSFIVIESLF